jgi:hypothetical protein
MAAVAKPKESPLLYFTCSKCKNDKCEVEELALLLAAKSNQHSSVPLWKDTVFLNRKKIFKDSKADWLVCVKCDPGPPGIQKCPFSFEQLSIEAHVRDLCSSYGGLGSSSIFKQLLQESYRDDADEAKYEKAYRAKHWPSPGTVTSRTQKPSVPKSETTGAKKKPTKRKREEEESSEGLEESPKCKCGANKAKRTVKKEGQNKGRLFWTCPKPQGEQCEATFEWIS